MMRTSRTILLNSASLVLGKIVANLIAIFASLRVVGYLGPERYGILSYVLTVLTFVQIFAGPVIDPIFVKKISVHSSEEEELLGNAVLLKLVLSATGAIVVAVYALFFEHNGLSREYLYLGAASLFFSINTLFIGVYQAHYKSYCGVLVEIASNVLSAAFLLWMIFENKSLVWIVSLQLFMIVPQLAANVALTKRLLAIRPRFHFRADVWAALVRESLPNFFGSIFIAINMRIDQALIYSFMDAAALGKYSSIVKLVECVNFVPMALVGSIYPLFCKTFAESRERFMSLFSRTCKCLSLMVFPLIIVVTLFPGEILHLFYGAKFVDVSDAFRVIVWSELFVFLSIAYSTAIMAAGIQHEILFYYPLGAAVNVLLNFILIPRYGVMGASIATLNSYGGLLLLMQFLRPKLRPYMKAYMASLLMPSTISLAVIALAWPMRDHLFLSLLLAAVLYVSALFVTRTIDSYDISLLKSALRIT